jgi:hypothetical protein
MYRYVSIDLLEISLGRKDGTFGVFNAVQSTRLGGVLNNQGESLSREKGVKHPGKFTTEDA